MFNISLLVRTFKTSFLMHIEWDSNARAYDRGFPTPLIHVLPNCPSHLYVFS